MNIKENSEKIVSVLPFKKCLETSLNAVSSYTIKFNGRRFSVKNLKTFALHGCTCVRCGKTGNAVVAWKDRGNSIHVDLFHFDGKNYNLMNRDHIVPRSKKGPNNVWNYQPMCHRCNTKKGNAETKEDLELIKFRHHWKHVYEKINNFILKKVSSFVVNGKSFKSIRGKLFKKILVLRDSYLYKISWLIAKTTYNFS